MDHQHSFGAQIDFGKFSTTFSLVVRVLENWWYLKRLNIGLSDAITGLTMVSAGPGLGTQINEINEAESDAHRVFCMFYCSH